MGAQRALDRGRFGGQELGCFLDRIHRRHVPLPSMRAGRLRSNPLARQYAHSSASVIDCLQAARRRRRQRCQEIHAVESLRQSEVGMQQAWRGSVRNSKQLHEIA